MKKITKGKVTFFEFHTTLSGGKYYKGKERVYIYINCTGAVIVQMIFFLKGQQ